MFNARKFTGIFVIVFVAVLLLDYGIFIAFSLWLEGQGLLNLLSQGVYFPLFLFIWIFWAMPSLAAYFIALKLTFSRKDSHDLDQSKLEINESQPLRLAIILTITLAIFIIIFFCVALRPQQSFYSLRALREGELEESSLSATTLTWQKYEDDYLSFEYPTDWVVKVDDERLKLELCDLHLIDKETYPLAGVQFGACQATGIAPATAIIFHRFLNLRPRSTLTESNYPNPAIQLSYYENSENLSVPDFNRRYLNGADGGIWSQTDISRTNANGLTAYYDNENYCVAVCQTYVWLERGRIYILNNFPTGAVSQEEIFNRIFQGLKPSGQGWSTYTDDILSFEYPADWKALPRQVFGSHSVVEFRCSGETSCLTVSIKANYNNATGKAYTSLTEYRGINDQRAKTIALSDLPAQLITDEGEPEQTIPYEEVLVFSPDRQFISDLYYQKVYDKSSLSKQFLTHLLKTFRFISPNLGNVNPQN